MKKDKVTMFAEESYNDLDDNIGIVMPILTAVSYTHLTLPTILLV